MSQPPDHESRYTNENNPSVLLEVAKQRALKQIDDITFRNLVINVPLVLIFGGCLLAMEFAHWQIRSIWLHEASYVNLRLGPGLVIGIVFAATLNELISWWRWQRKIEAVLQEGTPAPSYSIRLREDRRRIMARYRSVQYPKKRFFDVEIFPQTCTEISLGHDFEAAIYLDPGGQTPLAIEMQKGFLLVRPPIIGALTLVDYFCSRWASKLFPKKDSDDEQRH